MWFNTILDCVRVSIERYSLHRMSMTDKTERTRRKSANVRFASIWIMASLLQSIIFFCVCDLETKNKHETHVIITQAVLAARSTRGSWFGLSTRSEDKIFCLVFASSAGSNEWKNNNNNKNKKVSNFICYLFSWSAIVRWMRAPCHLSFCGIFALRRPHRWRWPMTILFAERKQMCISTVLSI